MKKLLLLVIAIAVVIGCSKDDGVGAYAISGAPEITSIAAGYKRIEVTWQHNTSSDESNYTNIYWSDGSSSSGMAITSGSASTFSLDLSNISEGEHTFYAQNVNTIKGTSSAESAPVTIFVWGDSYIKDLAQRTIASIDYLDGDDVEEGAYITWSSFDNSGGALGNMLYYYGQGGRDTQLFCPIDESTSFVADAIVEYEVDYATLYCPEGCLDTLSTSSITGESFPMSNDGIIRVASPEAMQPYFAMDNVYVILQTGEYSITSDDFAAGSYQARTPSVSEGDSGEAILTVSSNPSLFYLSGNGSTYDFGGSTITVPTATYQYIVGLGGGKCDPIRYTGNENVLKNLTWVEEGEFESKLTGITNVTIDGRDNRLESFNLRSLGSYPYGYGELFGKGGTNTISHQKHCGILVRGDDNHVLNCDIYHRAYGHCLFMQGAFRPTIENCNILAEVSTTQAVYAEKGTGSAADLVDFLTYFGYYMNENYNYTMALCEEGIRAYDGGTTIIDGEPYVRTEDVLSPTIIGCTVKNARGGITLSHTSGTVTVSDCTVIGCGRGFAIRRGGTITDCKADAQFGPAFGVDYTWHGSNIMDITIIDQESAEYVTVDGVDYETCNGTAQIMQLQGSNQNMKIRDGRVKDKGLEIKIKPSDYGSYPDPSVGFARIDIGGDDRNIGAIWDENGNIDDDDYKLTNSIIANETDWPIWIDANSSGCHIYTNGKVYIESGSLDNTIYLKSEGDIYFIGGAIDSSNILIYEDWDIDEVDITKQL